MIIIAVYIIEAVTYVSSTQSIDGDNILLITQEPSSRHQSTCQVSHLFWMVEANLMFIH